MTEAEGTPENGPEPPATTGGGEDRASALRVVTVAGLLLLLVAAGGMLLRPGDATLEPDAFLAEVFADVDQPFPAGLVIDEARRLPTGERLARFEADGSHSGRAVELTIVEFPVARGEDVIKEQLSSLRFKSGDMGSGGPGRGGPGRGGPSGGWGSWGQKSKESKSKLREKGTLSWFGYDADFARLRHEDGTRGADLVGGAGAPTPPPVDTSAGEPEQEAGAAYETIRINLSTGGRCLLAYIRFDEGYEPSKDDAAEVLAGLHPVQ